MTLTRQHRRRRLCWARQFQHWQHRNWQRVLFFDESRFQLFRADGRTRIYRRVGERTAPCCVRETVPFGGGSVMVLAESVGNNGQTLLSLTEILPHTVTSTRFYVPSCYRSCNTNLDSCSIRTIPDLTQLVWCNSSSPQTISMLCHDQPVHQTCHQ